MLDGMQIGIAINVSLNGLNKLNQLSEDISKIGNLTSEVEKKMQTLGQTLDTTFSGMALAHFGHDLERVLNVAGKLSDQIVKMKLVGYSPIEIQEANKTASATSSLVPSLTLDESNFLGMELGSMGKVTQGLSNNVAQLGRAITTFTGEENKDVVRNLIKSTEYLGKINGPNGVDPTKVSSEATELARTVAVGRGIFNLSELTDALRMNSQYIRERTGNTRDVMAPVAVMLMEYKGRTGQTMNAMDRALTRGEENGKFRTALYEIGAMDKTIRPHVAVDYATGKQYKDYSTQLVHPEIFKQLGSEEWAQRVLRPQAIETFKRQNRGIEPDEHQLQETIENVVNLIPQQNAARGFEFAASTQYGSLLENVKTNRAKQPDDEEFKRIATREGWKNAVANFSGALESFAQVAGGPMVAAAASALNAMADGLSNIREFLEAHPLVTAALSSVTTGFVSLVGTLLVVKTTLSALAVLGRIAGITAMGGMLAGIVQFLMSFRVIAALVRGIGAITGVSTVIAGLTAGTAAAAGGVAAAGAGVAAGAGTAAVAGEAVIAAEALGAVAVGGMGLLGPFALIVGAAAALFVAFKGLEAIFPETIEAIKKFVGNLFSNLGQGEKKVAQEANMGSTPLFMSEHEQPIGFRAVEKGTKDREDRKLDEQNRPMGTFNPAVFPKLPETSAAAAASHAGNYRLGARPLGGRPHFPTPQPYVEHNRGPRAPSLDHQRTEMPLEYQMRQFPNMLTTPNTASTLPPGVAGIGAASVASGANEAKAGHDKSLDLHVGDLYAKTLFVGSMTGSTQAAANAASSPEVAKTLTPSQQIAPGEPSPPSIMPTSTGGGLSTKDQITSQAAVADRQRGVAQKTASNMLSGNNTPHLANHSTGTGLRNTEVDHAHGTNAGIGGGHPFAKPLDPFRRNGEHLDRNRHLVPPDTAKAARSIAPSAAFPGRANATGDKGNNSRVVGGSRAFPQGSVGASFAQKGPMVMGRLMKDFGLTKEQAAGIVGNLGHESGGFKEMQEKNPLGGGKGGYGWAQWTGPRRQQFFDYARKNGLDPKSDEANYGFLKQELQTTEKASLAAVRGQTSVHGSEVAFERSFERAGVKNYTSRDNYANTALANFNPSQQEQGPSQMVLPPPSNPSYNVQADVHLDGDLIAQHTFKGMFDVNPSASAGTTGFDKKMNGWSSGTSLPI